jgi:hypothetical protein
MAALVKRKPKASPTGNQTDRAAWYCEKCTALLYVSEYVTGLDGFRCFRRRKQFAVESYTVTFGTPLAGNVATLVHWVTALTPHLDTPEKREARKQW